VDPSAQWTGIGTAFRAYWEKYVSDHGGSQLVFFTNSRKNLDFYLHRGYEIFDEREFEYAGKKMGSWSLRKKLKD
jgi:GNAT superfamily N-acetyltransferase